jgi:Holliday junction resolvase RusA-like endonuclease
MQLQYKNGHQMKINITPVAKPRMTKSDKWKRRPAVLKYRAFCDELRLKYQQPLPASVRIDFEIAMPDSWAEKKKEKMWLAGHHTTKPDLDNLVKSVLDALCKDDSHIYRIHASKMWARTPSITIKEI